MTADAEGSAGGRPASRGWVWLWGAGYVLLLAAVVWAMFSARRSAIAELATPQAVGDWQQWRDEVGREQVEPGPVQRRVPKSAEPPTLVLMRDYFAVSLVGAVGFSSILYWILAWLITGMMRTPDVVGMDDRPTKKIRA